MCGNISLTEAGRTSKAEIATLGSQCWNIRTSGAETGRLRTYPALDALTRFEESLISS